MSTATLTACPFRVGEAISFRYPLDNRYSVSTRLTPRRFAVHKIFDLATYKIEPWAKRMRPDLRRSRYLLLGHDLIKHEWRSFYVGSIREANAIDEPLFRFALFDPVNPLARPKLWGSSVFTEAEKNRPLIGNLLACWNAQLAASRDARIVGVVPWGIFQRGV